MKIQFEFERSTKNTHRFHELNEEPVIGTLYIQKSAIEELTGTKEAPKNLVLTIEKV